MFNLINQRNSLVLVFFPDLLFKAYFKFLPKKDGTRPRGENASIEEYSRSYLIEVSAIERTDQEHHQLEDSEHQAVLRCHAAFFLSLENKYHNWLMITSLAFKQVPMKRNNPPWNEDQKKWGHQKGWNRDRANCMKWSDGKDGRTWPKIKKKLERHLKRT